MKRLPLILASSSPRRADLLRQLRVEFRVVPSDATELWHEHLSPLELCQLNAHRKARAVAKKNPDALVLGADTLVYLGNEMLGKPHDPAEARAMLTRLRGRTHQVVTGVCLIHLRAHRERVFAVSTDVLFRAFDEATLTEYLAKVDTLDKAGAYAIQQHGEWLVSEISGSYSNVVGLPLERLEVELQSWPAH